MDRLQQRAPAAVCSLLRALLDTAAACAERLADANDSEALHDFRVALRRLNANQRAYRAALDVKLGKGMRRLARATNAARDREVQLDWLRLQRQESAEHAGVDLDALIDKLAHAHELERVCAYPQWQAAFAELAEKWRRRLDCATVTETTPDSFSVLTGTQVRILGDKLKRELDGIEAHGEDAAVHAARITGKRLRYLLEPLVGTVPGVPPLIKRLKALQDLLGDIHDCEVRLDDFAGRQQPDRVDQYAGLKRDTALRRAHLIEVLQTHWLGERMDVLFKPLQRVIARLNKYSDVIREAT